MMRVGLIRQTEPVGAPETSKERPDGRTGPGTGTPTWPNGDASGSGDDAGDEGDEHAQRTMNNTYLGMTAQWRRT